MANLQDYLENAELVLAHLGSWPSFHDAEVIRIELDRGQGVTARIEVKLIPYDPSGESKKSLLILLFTGLEDVQLSGFNGQNVLWSLEVQDLEPPKLVMETSYGLEGSFIFRSGEVVSIADADV